MGMCATSAGAADSGVDPAFAHYSAIGLASWYGSDFHGGRTADGERFDMGSISAAHRSMPMPCYARVTNLRNGRSIVVRVNDRGPFVHNRLIDVSARVATLLDFKSSGVARVKVDYVGKAPRRRFRRKVHACQPAQRLRARARGSARLYDRGKRANSIDAPALDALAAAFRAATDDSAPNGLAASGLAVRRSHEVAIPPGRRGRLRNPSPACGTRDSSEPALLRDDPGRLAAQHEFLDLAGRGLRQLG